MTSNTKAHAVPYFSQYQTPALAAGIATGERTAADDPRWATSGADTREEYAWWAGRLCGVACLRMALAHWRIDPPQPVPLARDLVDAGAYTVDGDTVGGLFHEPFARHVTGRWQLAARPDSSLTRETVHREITGGALVILSVHQSIRTLDPAPPQRGGHLVLAHTADERTVTIHNPSGWPGVSQKNHRIEWRALDRFFAGRGIILGPHPN
ncbi:C39 family peptidase [Kitasatospora sp. NPDC015120]|uniref:C39 family peptidase n=1 Tax=Kitasatospora sp. NPDC015120 TaxID=3364023 RepID=UPI0036F452A3